MAEGAREDRLTLWQRSVLRRLRRSARKSGDEPLTPDDWAMYFKLMSGRTGRVWGALLRALPASPRCGICGAPFSGFGSRLVRPLGYRPSRKNPTLCATCVEASPPGGTTTEVGVLFADLRGFTRLSEQSDPEAVSILLRRFYSCAEDVLFPEAVIDKLIGDEVMALYLPMYGELDDPATTMLEQRPASCSAASATAASTVLSSRSGSASTTARPSSATSASARSTTSPRSATWSTSRRAFRDRRRVVRSSLPGVWSSGWPSRWASGSRST
jgi:hypothetical protein